MAYGNTMEMHDTQGISSYEKSIARKKGKYEFMLITFEERVHLIRCTSGIQLITCGCITLESQVKFI